jgi:hypothetical protein
MSDWRKVTKLHLGTLLMDFTTNYRNYSGCKQKELGKKELLEGEVKIYGRYPLETRFVK